jgi:hypothetical protein
MIGALTARTLNAVDSKHEDVQCGKPEGRYANFFEIGYNAAEVVLDFGQSYANIELPSFHTRIVTAPMYAKQLMMLMQESIARYEAAYGPVSDGDMERGKLTQ